MTARIPQKTDASPDAVADQALVARLRADPTFFQRHPALLASLEIPHESGPAISLIERQVAVLRVKNDALNGRLQELIATAKRNEQLAGAVQGLAIRLFALKERKEFPAAVEQQLRSDFSVECAAVRLRADETADDAVNAPLDWAAYAALCKDNAPFCGALGAALLTPLFAAAAAERIGSVALIPLGAVDAGLEGLIALGNADPRCYRAGVGDRFLVSLGTLATAALRSIR